MKVGFLALWNHLFIRERRELESSNRWETQSFLDIGKIKKIGWRLYDWNLSWRRSLPPFNTFNWPHSTMSVEV